MVADYCIRRPRLSSRDTNAIGTAYSCLGCHSCRSHSRADHSIRCGHILMRSMDTVPGCTNCDCRNCLRSRRLPAALKGEDIASRSSMKEYLQSERARCSPVTTCHKEFTTRTLSALMRRTFPDFLRSRSRRRVMRTSGEQRTGYGLATPTIGYLLSRAPVGRSADILSFRTAQPAEVTQSIHPPST